MQQAALGSIVVAAALVVFDFAENREQIVPRPAAIAQLRPGVVIARLTAHIDQAVDGARAAQQTAARHRNTAIGHAFLGFGFIAPIGRRILDQLTVADRHPAERMAARAGLQQQDFVAAIGGQSIGQDTARRSGANDDVIIGVRRHIPRSPVQFPAFE